MTITPSEKNLSCFVVICERTKEVVATFQFKQYKEPEIMARTFAEGAAQMSSESFYVCLSYFEDRWKINKAGSQILYDNEVFDRT